MERVSTLMLIPAITTLLLLSGPADAHGATIAHWRFEDDPGFATDSSGHGFALTPNGSGATQYTLPASGDGRLIDDPIPQTGQSNAKAASFDGGGWLAHEDEPEFSVSAFTIEAYIHRDTLDTRQVIASQYGSVNNQRSWALLVESNNSLGMFLSENGDDVNLNHISGIPIYYGVDYFVAASFDPTDRETGVKFYAKHLALGLWWEWSMAPKVGSVYDTSAAINLGGYANGSRLYSGLVDEVRLSDTVLSKSELLAFGEVNHLPGDLNGDGFVGGDDLDIVRSSWGQTVTPGDLLRGDPSSDGFVGGDDLDIVRANWGQGTPPAPGVVPEPTALVLLMGGLLGALFFPRRNEK